MHTDLSPHLHTSECNQLIEQLATCHTENKFIKFLGVCNEFDSQLVKCLKRERQARAAANRVKAAERQKLVRERMLSS
ncbi:COX assembly mitochondrial protein 2 homolog [Anastrepha obliqua]|uniref:COX assembly mitochondrial protein 2 homolog n=1 Tax=Anastrepha obliqua TaxID=95512 RepID=UPI002409E130|nr:COX assembly mitochondrial protein 2 homolog [Anastrepha obliqua]